MKELAVPVQSLQTETLSQESSDISMAFELLTQEIYELCLTLDQSGDQRQVCLCWSPQAEQPPSQSPQTLTIHKDCGCGSG